tara:strand:+ start:3007 stop:4218 length:1212 start_codon:yes stop_codon:yes gene_type:complete
LVNREKHLGKNIMNSEFPLMKNNILREDLDKVIRYLQTDDPILTQSKNVIEFEEKWSKWLGVKYSVFTNSGSSANLLSLALLKIEFPEGGEVIVPPLTWVSDISSVIQNGFTPVFADIDLDTLSLNTDQIIKAVSDKTRAVFLTHAQGFNGLTDKLIDFLKSKNIHLIEDVCESHGASHNNLKVGTFGWLSNFSFYYAHHMTTIEGGMISTNNEEVYQNARMLRSHGLVREINNRELRQKKIDNHLDLNPEFIFQMPAYNVRNNEIGGILGISQLQRLDEDIKKRTNNLIYFLDKINDNRFQNNFKIKGSSNYAFNLILKEPDQEYMSKLMLTLNDNGVEFRLGSAGGGNQLRQPYLKGLFPEKFYLKFPNTEHIHFYGFYMGNYPSLHKDDIDRLCNIINNA